MNKFNETDVFRLLQRSENICRFCFCAIENVECYSLFGNGIFQILQFCLGNQTKFSEDNFLPKSICSNCYSLLENTYSFLHTIIESQNIVNRFIEQRQASNIERESFSEEDSDNRPLVDLIDEPDNIDIKTIRDVTEETTISDNQRLKPKKIKKTFIEKSEIAKVNCNQKFKTKTESVAHKRSHGIIRKNYECSICKKKYGSYFELGVHLRKHSGEKPFSCNVCGKSFTDKRNLKKHEKIHLGHKTHECMVCHKTFLYSFSLKTHERLHTGERPFVCENCGKSFNTSTELKLHNRTHTKERPYVCSTCEKAFSSKAALNTHTLVHTGEKKYSCSICSRKCRTPHDLKTHMRCHSNEKPYVCTYINCDKSYKNSSQLNVHLRTHKGEKPHHCPVCCKRFGESNTLTRHMTTHAKNVVKIEEYVAPTF